MTTLLTITSVPLSSHIWLVALNFQTPCKEMDLNQARFLSNGMCGYTLKPEFQRDLSSQMNPNSLTEGPWLQKKTLHIMVRGTGVLHRVWPLCHSNCQDSLGFRLL